MALEMSGFINLPLYMEEKFRGRCSMVKTPNFQKSFFHSIPEFLEYKKGEVQNSSEILNNFFP